MKFNFCVQTSQIGKQIQHERVYKSKSYKAFKRKITNNEYFRTLIAVDRSYSMNYL